ncbi:LOW QUALITY PROTEIN: sin3 histone deacetylase corepressor complex component SDS3 [Petromyzon marinus]|uniref:Sin3 histone deacetylase corepressor complex component SDS3 n=1 Tax=Petromyzon marinus TaxID=7757 RepID=A0AAJ7SKC9_PETMA|nr:sin3 histone deacetylase corepressor complex component SDS3 [Petromyzon marinus]
MAATLHTSPMSLQQQQPPQQLQPPPHQQQQPPLPPHQQQPPPPSPLLPSPPPQPPHASPQETPWSAIDRYYDEQEEASEELDDDDDEEEEEAAAAAARGDGGGGEEEEEEVVERRRRRNARARESDEDTEDASETDLAKHHEDGHVEIKERMYQEKLSSLKKQLQHLHEGTLQEYQKRLRKLDQQCKERIRNADLFLQLETEQVERSYVRERRAAVKEFEDRKVELKESLVAELEEKKKIIETERLTMELTGDSMEVKPIMTRKLRRRPNDPVPLPDKRRKPPPSQLNYLLLDEQIQDDLRVLNKGKPFKRAESPSQRFEARIDDGKLCYDRRCYHKSQPVFLEARDTNKISCVISSIGTNEVWVRKTSDSSKIRVYLSQLQRGKYVLRNRSTS